LSEFILKRKSLPKSVRGYCWFLFVGSLALFSLVFLDEVRRYIFGEQGLLEMLDSIWFPILLLIAVLLGFRLIRKATKEKVYAVLRNDHIEFPNIPKSHYYDGLPAFQKWPISEVRSARTKFINDARLIDNYGFRDGLALNIEGTYWSIFMPAKKLDYVAEFVSKVNERAKVSINQPKPSYHKGAAEAVAKTFSVSRLVIERELYILALYIAMTIGWLGLAVFFVDQLIVFIPGLVMGLYSICGVIQKLMLVVAAMESRMTIEKGILKFTRAKKWWVGRNLISAFDLPEGSIDLRTVDFIRYSQFPLSKLIFPWLFFRSFISENITLVVGDREFMFYHCCPVNLSH